MFFGLPDAWAYEVPKEDVLGHDVACRRGDALAFALRGPQAQAVEAGPLEGLGVNSARRRRGG
eukprot:8078788-Alexandrium_andersonii.AAC.1